MTGIQSRAESVGISSDDEPLSKMGKPGKKCSEDTPSDFLEDDSVKKTGKETASSADVKLSGSDDDDDQPLTKIIKKKQQKQKADREEPEDARKTRSPKKRKAVTKSPKRRESSPSPSPSPGKITPRKGRKGKNNSKKKAPTAVNATDRGRGQAKKEAACGDSSGDESSNDLMRKRSEPAMKQAVVLLQRMSERDVRDAVARGRTHNQERKGSAAESSDEEPLSQKLKRLKEQRKTARGRRPPAPPPPPPPPPAAAAADASSDDETLVRKVKTAKVKDKFRKRANGEEDTVNQDKDLSDNNKQPD